MKKVLLTGAGGAAAVSFMKATRESDIEIYAADMDPMAAGLYLVPINRRVIIPAADDPGFIINLLVKCIEFQIDILVPTVDAELLSVARAKRKFDAINVKLLLSKEKALEVCLDKFRLANVCRDAIPTPRTCLFDSNFDSSNWDFPLILKPRSGSGSRGIHLVDSKEELSKFSRSEEVIVQEFLPGTEYSVDVMVKRNGEVVAAVPRVRYKVDSGIAVASRTVSHPTLEKLARKVATTVGITYVANIQFRKSRENKYMLLEVNPRFPGTMPLTVQSGVNIPVLCLDDLMGMKIQKDAGKFKELGVVRYWQEQFVSVYEMVGNDHKKLMI